MPAAMLYWRFAVTTGLGAPEATGPRFAKAIRDLVRDLVPSDQLPECKRRVSRARKTGKTLAEAKELASTYMRRPTPTPRAGAKRSSIAPDLTTGYARILGGVGEAAENAPATELMNWPIQSAGADLMRLVCIAATEAGIENSLRPCMMDS